MAESNLRRACGVESREDDSSLVRDAIPVRILEEQEIGSARDEDATVPRHDAVRVREVAGEVQSRVETSITVAVFQKGDDALRGRLRGALEWARIATILHDVESAPFVERHGHGIPDQRLRGCQLDPVARLELETRQRLVWGQRAIRSCGALGAGAARGGART